MRKCLFAVLAAIASGVALAFTPVAYTNSFTRDGVTYVQRGALGTKEYVVTNVDAQTVGRVQSVNGKTGTVVLGADDVGALTNTTTHLSGDVPTSRKVNGKALTSDITLNAVDVNARPNDWTPNASQVGALPDNQASLEANTNFRAAVATVSPPVALPDYWSVTALTNSDGIAVDSDGFIYLRSGDTRCQIEDNGYVKCATKDNEGRQVYWAFDGYRIYLKWYENNQAKTKTIQIANALTLQDVKNSDQRGTAYSAYPISSDAMTAFLQPYITAYTASQTYQTLTGMSAYQTVAGMSQYQTVAGMSAYQTTAGMSDYQTVAGMSSYETKQDATAKLTDAKAYTDGQVQTNVVKLYSPDKRFYIDGARDVWKYVAPKEWNFYSPFSQKTVRMVRHPTEANTWQEYQGVDSLSFKMKFTGTSYILYYSYGAVWQVMDEKSGDEDTQTITFMPTYQVTAVYLQGNWNKVDTIMRTSDMSGYVPTTRKVNGQALTSDITIQGMTADAVVLTNGTLKTYDGRAVDAMDYPALTNTVNEVKAKFYDQPLQVEWTVRMVNGDMKLYATTNVNTSVLNN